MRDVQELTPVVDAVYAMLVETLVKRGLNPDGLIGEEQCMIVIGQLEIGPGPRALLSGRPGYGGARWTPVERYETWT